MRGRGFGVLFLLPAALVVFMAHTSAKIPDAAQHAGSAKKAGTDFVSAEAAKWAEATLQKMSVDEKIGQLLFTTYHGSLTPTDAAAYAQIMHDVVDLQCGGFINITQASPLGIVKSQAYPTAVLTNQLQAKSKLPLIIGADFERGAGMRLDEGTSFPTAMALAAGGKPADAYTMGKLTALEARAVGIQWVYAPVADVNNNPGNPIINTRSFGEDPAKVAEYVTQFVRGVEENGGLATAKHFPGHGDTASDSHIDLPVIHADRERLASSLSCRDFRRRRQRDDRALVYSIFGTRSEYPGDAFFAHFDRSVAQRTGLSRIGGYRCDGYGRDHGAFCAGRGCGARGFGRS
jgi:Glycosyl hydrolase family 3 N terminal domain